jgi:hypothetical protein
MNVSWKARRNASIAIVLDIRSVTANTHQHQQKTERAATETVNMIETSATEAEAPLMKRLSTQEPRLPNSLHHSIQNALKNLVHLLPLQLRKRSRNKIRVRIRTRRKRHSLGPDHLLQRTTTTHQMSTIN